MNLDKDRTRFSSRSQGDLPEEPRLPARTDAQQGTGSSRVSAPLRTLAMGVGATIVLPIAVYFLIRPHLASYAAVLAVSSAMPVIWSVARLIWQRRVDPLGVIAIVGFGVELVVTACLGSSFSQLLALFIRQDNMVHTPRIRLPTSIDHLSS